MHLVTPVSRRGEVALVSHELLGALARLVVLRVIGSGHAQKIFPRRRERHAKTRRAICMHLTTALITVHECSNPDDLYCCSTSIYSPT